MLLITERMERAVSFVREAREKVRSFSSLEWIKARYPVTYGRVRGHYHTWRKKRQKQIAVLKPWAERFWSPLLLRILAVNVIALAFLVGGVLYLGNYEQRLIDSELASLHMQARLSASALGEGAVVIDTDEQNILSPMLARLMIRRLVEVSDVRTRLFSQDGVLLADSRILLGRMGRVQKVNLIPRRSFFSHFVGAILFPFEQLSIHGSFPLYSEREDQPGTQYEIVDQALSNGESASQVWREGNGKLVLGVAVPVQRYKQILGALMLTRPDTTIADAMRSVRFDILKIFTVALLVTALLSVYLTRAIAHPIRLLAQAADKVRHGQQQIVGLAGTARLLNVNAIPDFSARKDEIGELSGSLRDMTAALAARVSTIENFAADVAHEIKNPLTSLISAVDTFGLVQDDKARARLMEVIRDDVVRLDRLISDISNASRLDAELSRDEAVRVDMRRVLETMVDFYKSYEAKDGSGHADVVLDTLPDQALIVQGVEGRLVQVFQNLINNALSFSVSQSQVVLRAWVDDRMLYISVDDEGPGIPENKLEAIFNRFYSERPKTEKFGMHSGLGLSISRQIVQAHRGRVWAENRRVEDRVLGARFVVALPLVG